MMAIERVGAAATSHAGMIGPVSTILLSVALLDEELTIAIIVGTALVLAGVWTLARGASSGQVRSTK